MSWGWNFGDGLDFEGVHDNTYFGNDESEEALAVMQNTHLRGFKQMLY
jgi:hypothetical protein